MDLALIDQVPLVMAVVFILLGIGRSKLHHWHGQDDLRPRRVHAV